MKLQNAEKIFMTLDSVLSFMNENSIEGRELFCVASLDIILHAWRLLTYARTLPFKMFGPFGSVWCKTALAEVCLSLP